MSSGEKASSKKFTKAEKSWILYDWANSVYATNIMAVLFPIYFGNVCAAAGADNLVLWSYGTSVPRSWWRFVPRCWGPWPITRAIKSGCLWPA